MTTKLHIGLTALALTLCGNSAWAETETQDSLVNIAFGKIDKRDVISAASFVNINSLSKKNANNSALSDVSTHVGGYNGSIWGQGPLVLIDGVPRDASMVKASEVESVSILKDATAVALYGSKGAKGVVLITTKRGTVSPMKIDVRANVGAMIPKSYPKYLDAATYMGLYNEACINDGKSPLYDDATIYNTAMGTNPYRYPDLDFYSSDYLREFVTTADITGEVYGGTDKTRYYLNIGVDYTNNLLKYGEYKKSNQFDFNVRGNVDMTIASWLKATTNAAIILNDNLSGRGDFWGNANSLRPNWFSPLLPVSMMDPNNADIQDFINTSTHLIDGKYLLGGTTSNQTNAFSEALAAGYTRQKYRKFLFDLTLDADLGRLTKGLSFKGAFSVDYNAHYSEAYALPYAVYNPTWANVNGQDMIVGLDKINEDKSSTNEYVGQSTYHQTMMGSIQFDYVRSFADAHNVNATLVGWGYQQHYSADSNHTGDLVEGGYHRPSNLNAGLRLDYNYKHRYYADLTGTVVHSSKLPKNKRNAFSPAVSVAWRLSNEDFMQSSRSWLDDLKIMASYANLHQDIDINDYYLYKADYQFSPSSGWYQWADGTVGGATSTSKRGANDQLSYITRKEYRIGLDATLFDGLLNVNANWFDQTTNGLLTQGASTVYPSFYNSGTGNFLPYINYNKDQRTGFDYTVNLNKNFGDWDFSLGLVGMVYESKAKLRDEVWEEDYLYRQGHSLSASWGYVCEGFFQSEDEIASSPKQSFGGTVRPGDLKYKDINGDNVIDSKDQVIIGNEGSPYVYGMNFTAKYKNFTLYLSGNGISGGKMFKQDSYHWLRGTSKFSEMALNRWTAETAETATFPRLTTENGDNNYQHSTFWMTDNDRFTLDNLQLTYDINSLGKCFIKGISVYAGAYNLLTISKERKYLERSFYGPQYRTVYIGCKLNM